MTRSENKTKEYHALSYFSETIRPEFNNFIEALKAQKNLKLLFLKKAPTEIFGARFFYREENSNNLFILTHDSMSVCRCLSKVGYCSCLFKIEQIDSKVDFELYNLLFAEEKLEKI